VTRAYGGAVVRGGPGTSESLRARVARGRPNWWVILAVTLGLMALLVATAGSSPRPAVHRGAAPASATVHHAPPSDARRVTDTGRGAVPSSPTTSPTTTTLPPTTTTQPMTAGAGETAQTRLTAGASSPVSTPQTPAPAATTTTLPTTTTTTESPSVPADRTQTQGYLDPPVQASNQYGFTGTGSMEVSVVWSGDIYLTMDVSCPSGEQSVGGTSAMAASLPDASGSCLATVSEPASESASLTYTITIGPAGG
jgi:hypothetical protein